MKFYTDSFQRNFKNYLYYSSLLLSVLHAILLLYWIIHVLYYLKLFYRRKRRVEINQQKLFEYREYVIRYFIFLAFLLCEFGYFFEYSLFGLFKMFWTYNDINPISMGHNCTLKRPSFLADMYDLNPGVIFLNFLRAQSTSLFLLMVWFYILSLLHLTHAARGILRPRSLKLWTLIGVIIFVVVFGLRIFPWSSLFGVIIQTVIGQVYVVVAWVISRRFTVALKSRVNEAFHTGNSTMKNAQQDLLRQYSCIIPTILVAFQLYYFSNTFLFNLHLLIESIFFDSCWFTVNYGIHFQIQMSEDTYQAIWNFKFILAIVARSISIISYFILLVLNIVFIFKSVKRATKSYKYRFVGFSGLPEEQKQPFLNQASE